MALLPAHPDVELIATSWLRTHPDVVALAPVTVAADLFGYDGETRIVLSRSGGVPGRFVDRPRLDLSVWAPDKQRAQTVTQIARAALHDLEGQSVAEGFVAAVTDISGLLWLPDDRADPGAPVPRYVCSLDLTTRTL